MKDDKPAIEGAVGLLMDEMRFKVFEPSAQALMPMLHRARDQFDEHGISQISSEVVFEDVDHEAHEGTARFFTVTITEQKLAGYTKDLTEYESPIDAPADDEPEPKVETMVLKVDSGPLKEVIEKNRC